MKKIADLYLSLPRSVFEISLNQRHRSMDRKNVKIVELWLWTNAECILEEKARTKNVSLNEIEEERNKEGARRRPQPHGLRGWSRRSNGGCCYHGELFSSIFELPMGLNLFYFYKKAQNRSQRQFSWFQVLPTPTAFLNGLHRFKGDLIRFYYVPLVQETRKYCQAFIVKIRQFLGKTW